MVTPVIDVSIMAHPRRAVSAKALALRFRQFPVRIVFDPSPDAPSSTIRTARRAWAPWFTGATHHLVVQDDIEPHDDFEEQVIQATKAQPDKLLSFFSEWGSFTSHALRVAALAGYSWVRQPDTYIGTQAALMPSKFAESFVVYLGDESEGTPDDHAIFAFANKAQLEYLVSNPNLVDHEANISLTGNGNQGARRAAVFLPSHAPDARWWDRRPLVGLVAIPSIHWTMMQRSSYAYPGVSGQRWRIESPQMIWGDKESRVEKDVERALAVCKIAGCADSLTPLLRDAAWVLADQVGVSQAVPGVPSHPIQELTAVAGARSLVPGCLRTELAISGGNVDTDAIGGAFEWLARRLSSSYRVPLTIGSAAESSFRATL